MTVLSMCRDVASRLGLSPPSTLFTGTDEIGAQLLALANEEIEDLRRFPWQALTLQAAFSTVAGELQSSLEGIAPGCDYIINDTIWNRTLRRPVFGPLAPQRWQQLKAMSMQGPWSQFRIRNGFLYMLPAPPEAQDCYFEYITRDAVLDPLNSMIPEFTSDLDTPMLDEALVKLGIMWRFKAHKGFDYTEDRAKYDAMLLDKKARDGSKDILNLNDAKWDIFPAIMVPAGSWDI